MLPGPLIPVLTASDNTHSPGALPLPSVPSAVKRCPQPLHPVAGVNSSTLKIHSKSTHFCPFPLPQLLLLAQRFRLFSLFPSIFHRATRMAFKIFNQILSLPSLEPFSSCSLLVSENKTFPL